MITPAEAAAYWPLMNASDIVGAVWLPGDGRTNPADTTQAFAKGAKMAGAQIFEGIKVTDVLKKNGRVTGVSTGQGDISCEIVVNCAGMWAREVGKWAGVNIPLHAAEHFYIITEPIEGLQKDLPTLRDPGGYTYYREEVGAILAGFFEPNAKPWGMKGIPDEAEFIRLAEDWEHLDVALDAMAHRMPVTETAGIHTFFNGPESFTPDDAYHLGEAPELKGFYVAAGFNSIGIQSSGGAGKVLADWIKYGHPPMDLWDVDIRRNMPFQNNSRYLHDRTTEGLGLLYDMHWPFKQFKTSRYVRKSPFFDRMKAQKRLLWYGGWLGTAQLVRPRRGYTPSMNIPTAVKTGSTIPLKSITPCATMLAFLTKLPSLNFRMQGKDAVHVLNRVCGNQMDMPIGAVKYTQILNARGGIESDVTVARYAEDDFMVIEALCVPD